MADFDEEDLINDYINDYDGPPEPDFDPEEYEEAPKEPEPPNTPLRTLPSPGTAGISSPDPQEDTINDVQESNLAVRAAYSRKRQPEFAFERYQESNSWRKETAIQSPSSKAKRWKTSGHSIRRKKAVSQDGVLVKLQSPQKRRSLRCSMSKTPILGESCRTMTLKDGTRVYFGSKKATRKSAHTNATHHHVLGESMASLVNKVNNSRREACFSKETLLDSPTSVVPEPETNSHLWVDTHTPTSFTHLLSHDRVNREVVRALRAWDPYVFHRAAPKQPDKYRQAEEPSKDKRPHEFSRVIMLSGPPGVGKTTLAHIIANHTGYRAVEVNASDDRSESALRERVLGVMETGTLSFADSRPTCLILDEIDGADATHSMKAIADIVRADPKTTKNFLRRPIICICNNKYAPALKPLLPVSRQFHVGPPSEDRLMSRLKAILKKEGLTCSLNLLKQLVDTASGDIRSCLHTLQFAASKLSGRSSLAADISEHVEHSLRGTGLKDDRNDLVGTLCTIFQKEKGPENRKVVQKVMEFASGFGDHSRTLDSLFLNVLQVPYVDPMLDVCSAAHEWMSHADLYRNYPALQSMHMLPVTGAIHLLCRVEKRQELVYTTRALADLRYNTEANQALLQKFVAGFSLQASGFRDTQHVATELAPNLLWILSAGAGTAALDRSVATEELLSEPQKRHFGQHAAVLQSLGLTYVVDRDEDTQGADASQHWNLKVRLEPPIHKLSQFSEMVFDRREIPAALKQMLTKKARQDRIAATERKTTSVQSRSEGLTQAKDSTSSGDKKATPDTEPRGKVTSKKPLPTLGGKRKRPKVHNFLIAGAKKAKEARSARNAARVGFQRASKDKLANTGSGVFLSKVVRLKYVKGFTQAVRAPCKLSDL